METIDPATGRSLGSDAIQRVLFVAGGVHVYNIPPMTPGKGHVAASWTAGGDRNHIFTARVRVIETSLTVVPTAPAAAEEEGKEEEQVKTDVVLEDPSSGQLFAAAPYTAQAVVEPVSDSSRFFALRVQDEAGRKATLGVGFEERSEAFDFSVALQEAQKSLGWGAGSGGPPGNKNKPAAVQRANSAEKRDLSLKEGETITVNLPPRFGRRKTAETSNQPSPAAELSAFSIPPPPPSAGHRNSLILNSPPSTSSSSKRHSKGPSAAELGFDDGKFGEFA